MHLPLTLYSFRKFLLFTSFALFSVVSFAQSPFFTNASDQRNRIQNTGALKQFAVFRLDESALRKHLSSAGVESDGPTRMVQLQVPQPDGSFETFQLWESPMLSPDIAKQFPEIKTYEGKSLLETGKTIRISLTSSGLNAIILGTGASTIYLERDKEQKNSEVIVVYFAKDATPKKKVNAENKCGAISPLQKGSTSIDVNKNARVVSTTGGVLRTFRLAMAADGEFVNSPKGGSGNQMNAYNSLVAYVNRMIAVYKRELSVSFTLVSGTNLVFTTPGTPYTNSDQALMLTQNQTTIDNVIGSANYDVGHVLGSTAGSGGGLASSPAVCDNTSKAQGVSGVGDGTFDAIFDDQLISHEVGHQFGMSHTFNSSIPVCTTREPTTSVEPGAGTTMMSYGYTCSDATGNDDYESPPYLPLLNFHTVSYEQAVTYIGTVACFTSSATTNVAPVIATISGNTTIPKSTPFSLTGTATDANVGDVLTYSWEGTNIGTMTPVPATLNDETQPPFFRSYAPSNSSTRTYPRLSAILDGTNKANGDKLPSVGITTTHRFTVRDNADGTTNGSVTVTVDGNSGPFLVTSNLNGTYASSSVQNVTWDVANTTAPPVSAPNVDILLSTDGGQTFTYILVANTPNDGMENVTLPNLGAATTQARLKVKASNNIFFDISNVNFSINAGALPDQLISFSGFKVTEGNRLIWKTSSETDMANYEIEKSVNGLSFVSIGKVSPNNDPRPQEYVYLDKNPSVGKNYYRLKMEGKQGDVKYSHVLLLVSNELTNENVSVQQNPVTSGTLSVKFSGVRPGAFNFQLVSSTGQTVLKTVKTNAGGTTVFGIPVSGVSSGVYTLLISGPDGIRYTEKVVISN